MCHVIPKVWLPPKSPSAPQKCLHLCLRCCPLGSWTQPSAEKFSRFPCLSPPLLSHVFGRYLCSYFILSDYILTIVFLSCLKGMWMFTKGMPLPKKVKFLTSVANKLKKFYSQWWEEGATGVLQSLGIGALTLLGGCPAFGKVALLNGPTNIHWALLVPCLSLTDLYTTLRSPLKITPLMDKGSNWLPSGSGYNVGPPGGDTQRQELSRCPENPWAAPMAFVYPKKRVSTRFPNGNVDTDLVPLQGLENRKLDNPLTQNESIWEKGGGSHSLRKTVQP